ncbi:MAG: hypothetical protein ACU84J_16290, partial [Gammaproteobacteria bacterium]
RNEYYEKVLNWGLDISMTGWISPLSCATDNGCVVFWLMAQRSGRIHRLSGAWWMRCTYPLYTLT